MTEWKIKDSDEIIRRIIPEGRYRCKLAEIREIQVPTFDNKEILEDKLVFCFEPLNIPGGPLKDREVCHITYFVRPANSTRSNMYKLLCSLSQTGTVPEEFRVDPKRYQRFAESFVGKPFVVTCVTSKSGKHNIGTAAMPSEEIGGVVARNKTPEEDDIPF